MSGGAHATEGLTDSSIEFNDVMNIPQVDGNFTWTSIILQEDHCDDNETTINVNSMQGDDRLESALLEETPISEATAANGEFEIFKRHLK